MAPTRYTLDLHGFFTQLFTEHYMVLFLLHNTLGAWHAGKVLAQNRSLALNAKDEAELRCAVSLGTAGGYEFEYLRFVRESEADEDAEPGPWRPMGGMYEGWPRTAAELKVLDPSCGSGHFLVAAFELLVRLRMHEEGISVEAAVEAVLSDNLFGLEIDPRCTQIAAFNVAMAVWKLTGPKPLPPMRNIACSGIPLGNSRDEWMKSLKVALPNSELGFQWGQLYDMFSKADTLGSLINPQRFFGSGLITDEQLEQISDALGTVIANDRNATDEQQELAAAAQGLTRATEMLSGSYTLVITNVPYLGRKKFDDILKKYIDSQYSLGRAELAIAFLLRSLEFCDAKGTTALVAPQNWLFLGTFEKVRRSLLENQLWDFVVKLGEHAFESSAAAGAFVAMHSITRSVPGDSHLFSGIDVSAPRGQAPIYSDEKDRRLRAVGLDTKIVSQLEQLDRPDATIGFEQQSSLDLLSKYAHSYQGACTVDMERFRMNCWEIALPSQHWNLHMSSPTAGKVFSGLSFVSANRSEGTQFHNMVRVLQSEGTMGGCWKAGQQAWGRWGVACSWMNDLPANLFCGPVFDNMVAVILPQNNSLLPAIWCFCSSPEFNNEVRKINQKVQVANATLVKVPFDLKHWQKVAAEKYPNGLPEPESDDPTQWVFHGHPDDSTSPLQVAVARLLGYRWPAELDSEMQLSQRTRDLLVRCRELDEFVDDDGIVCIPSVRGEDPASDRLLRMLHAAGVNRSENLETWLRDKFFQEHCELFHQRPFIWHIWDGKKDGFAALVNYHTLVGPQGKKLLESLTYSYLGDWITRQEAAVKNNESGADDRLLAAKELQEKLEAILHGEPPYDIFVRWKPLHEQPIGWTPDINDGVRMNIRPFMLAELSRGRKGAGVLRFPPKIKWTKDRGKEPKRPPEDYPWFWNWDEKKDDPTDFAGGNTFTGDRWNDLHYTNAFKLKTREAAKNREAQS